MMGYRSDPLTKKLQIDEEEAKTVRLIFEKYLALESLKQTVHEVNRLGLTSGHGLPPARENFTRQKSGRLHPYTGCCRIRFTPDTSGIMIPSTKASIKQSFLVRNGKRFRR